MIQSHGALKLLRYLLVALFVSLLFYLVGRIGIEEIVQRLSNMDPGWLLLAFACMGATFCFAALRYKSLLASDLSFTYLLRVILASFLLNYAAMVQGLGLGAKIGMLKARHVPISHSSAGIWLEICLDILVCSGIVVVFLFVKIGPNSEGLNVFSIPLIIVAVASLALLALRRFPGRFEFVNQFLSAFREVSSLKRLSSAMFYSIGIWVSASGSLYCILNSLQPSAPADLGLSIFAMASGFLTGLVTLIPGGIGVRELTWSYIVHQGGYPLELAGLAAVFYRISAIFLVLIALTIMSFLKWRSA